MKKEFSKAWNKSTQPRKQRKFRVNAPKHIKGKFLSAHLSKELRDKYGKRSMRLRTGDKVKVMRGNFKGEVGSVERVDTQRQKIYIQGVEITRRDGSKAHPPFKPSNLMITELDKGDAKRMEKIGEKPVKVEPKKEEEKKKSSEKEEKKESEKTAKEDKSE